MKKIVLTLVFIQLLIISFTSCKKDKVYLTDEQRSLLLYDVGDKFTLVKNETDTLNFTVTKKEFDFGEDYNGLFKSGTYYEHGYLEYKYENCISTIRVTSMTYKPETYWHDFKIPNISTIFFHQFYKTQDITVQNKTFTDCYMSISYDGDTLFMSTNIGIIYIKTYIGDEYKLLER